MKIETLALAIQKDFDSLHSEIADIRTDMAAMRDTMSGMATKEELRSTKDEILKAVLGAIKDLKQVVEHNDSKLSLYMARTDEIDIRLRVVEKRG